ncbi:MAG TPA: MarR family transcriptional regulator [Candidatus Acetothermia bacterium]|nr:MarR family transcriptional regulator [Candidatus Acetothermia bacterium]
MTETTGATEGPLGHLLAQVGKLLRDRIHARMEGIGIGRGQGFILFRLGEENGLAQADLARRAWVRPATLTAALQRLEEEGLVERRPDPTDARVSRVHLTAKGEATRRQAEAVWQEVEADLRAVLSEDDRAQLVTLLGKLRDALAEKSR